MSSRGAVIDKCRATSTPQPRPWERAMASYSGRYGTYSGRDKECSVAISLGHDQQRLCSQTPAPCLMTSVNGKRSLARMPAGCLGSHLSGKHSMARTLGRLPAGGKRRWLIIQRAWIRGNEMHAGRNPLLDAAYFDRHPLSISQAVRGWERAVRDDERSVSLRCCRRSGAVLATVTRWVCHQALRKPVSQRRVVGSVGDYRRCDWAGAKLCRKFYVAWRVTGCTRKSRPKLGLRGADGREGSGRSAPSKHWGSSKRDATARLFGARRFETACSWMGKDKAEWVRAQREAPPWRNRKRERGCQRACESDTAGFRQQMRAKCRSSRWAAGFVMAIERRPCATTDETGHRRPAIRLRAGATLRPVAGRLGAGCWLGAGWVLLLAGKAGTEGWGESPRPGVRASAVRAGHSRPSTAARWRAREQRRSRCRLASTPWQRLDAPEQPGAARAAVCDGDAATAGMPATATGADGLDARHWPLRTQPPGEQRSDAAPGSGRCPPASLAFASLHAQHGCSGGPAIASGTHGVALDAHPSLSAAGGLSALPSSS
ncbi:hypothetical protein PSPO01_13668 [Paraphaeosphaeria sporulosa]